MELLLNTQREKNMTSHNCEQLHSKQKAENCPASCPTVLGNLHVPLEPDVPFLVAHSSTHWFKCSTNVLISTATQVSKIVQADCIWDIVTLQFLGNAPMAKYLLKRMWKVEIQCNSPEIAQWLCETLCDCLFTFKVQMTVPSGLYFSINQTPVSFYYSEMCLVKFLFLLCRASLHLGSYSSVTEARTHG